MPDNSQPIAGGDIYSTDQITTLNGGAVATGEKAQRVKIGFGSDGTFQDVAAATPLPAAASGDTAAGAADAGNPVKVGGKANAIAPAPVAAGQRVDAWHDLFGRSVISDLDPELSLSTGLTTYRERLVASRYTVLADSIADGLASFWTSTVANGGATTTAGGEGLVQTSTALNGSAQLSSTAPAYHPGQSAWLLAALRFGDTGMVGNTRRVGAFTTAATAPQDGFYFELSDMIFNAVTCKAGVATAVAVGLWSRAAAAPFTLDANYHLFELRWTANRADFYIDSVLRHTVIGTSAPITATLNFPMTVQSINTSGLTNNVIAVRNIGLGRFGVPEAFSSAGPLSVAKAEDSAAADADVGIPAMAVRKAVPANTSNADGDYEMLQMSAGRLWTSATIDSALPAGSSTIGSVIVTNNAAVSTANSSGTVLGVSGVFTGTSEDIADYSSVKVSVFADQASATDGLQIQQSVNGINWDFVDAYTVQASTGKTFGAPVQAKFLRVVYTNGAVASTAFRLQTIFSKEVKQTGAVRPQDARPNENDFDESLAYLMGYNGASWDRLRSTTANGLVVDASRIVAPLPAGTNFIGNAGVRGFTITGTSGSIAAASTGTVGPLDVSAAGNCTFVVKNTVAASAYAGTPVIVFEQSDDNVSWGPLMAMRADTGATASSVTLGANTASGSLMFDAGLEGVAWVRARVTTGPATNAMTIAINAGGFAFSPYVSTIPQPLTKSVQGSQGMTTQDLKDAGRVAVMISCYRAAGIVTTEALFAAAAFSRTLDGAAATTGNQFTITAGKRFRIQAIECSLFGNAAAAMQSKLVLRYLGAGGTITNTSPIAAVWDVGSNVASPTGNYVGPTVFPIPDGLEFVAGSSFGFTNLSSAATVLHTLTLIGYEY